jgi:hypothetical protein
MHRIQPDEIHINLPTRPPAEPWIDPPEDAALQHAVATLEDSAPVRVAFPTSGTVDLSGCPNVVDAVIAVITRHPLCEDELERTLARWAPAQVREALAELEASGRAQRVTRHKKTFWTAAASYFPERANS